MYMFYVSDVCFSVLSIARGLIPLLLLLLLLCSKKTTGRKQVLQACNYFGSDDEQRVSLDRLQRVQSMKP